MVELLAGWAAGVRVVMDQQFLVGEAEVMEEEVADQAEGGAVMTAVVEDAVAEDGSRPIVPSRPYIASLSNFLVMTKTLLINC